MRNSRQIHNIIRASTSTLAVLLALLALHSPARADWNVWVEPATQKILPDRPPGDSTDASLEAARNEWEGLQIVVRSDDSSIENVDVVLPDLIGPDDFVIPVVRTRVYREWLVELTNPPECIIGCVGAPPELTREPGRYPDALVPFTDPYSEDPLPVGAPFELEPATSQAIFVDVYVPAEAPAGLYTTTFEVRAEGQQAVRIPVTLRVWDFALPAERRVATAYGFSSNLLGRYHGGADGLDAEEITRFIRNYEHALHEHHIDVTTINGPVVFQFDADGNLLEVDWTGYDAVVGPRLDGEYWPDGQPPVRFNTGRFRPGLGHGDLTEDQWAQAAAAFAVHLQEQGWLDRAYMYSHDEPFIPEHVQAYETIPADVQLLNRYTDLWKGHVLVTNPLDERLIGSVDIWCPVTPMYSDWFYNPPRDYPAYADYEERRALGEELWFYVCNANVPPWAGYDVDAPLGHEPRIVKWGAFQEDASGFLYWSTSYWHRNDPWHIIANVEVFGDLGARNGDGILLYPGDHDGPDGEAGSPPEVSMDGPALSYCMKMVRDGLEDWELFLLASELGARDYVRSQVARAYTQFGAHFVSGAYDPEAPPWTVDDALLYEVRRNVAAKVLYLLHPDDYPDPETPVLEPDPEPVAETAPDAGADPAIDVSVGDADTEEEELANAEDADSGTVETGDEGCGCGSVPTESRPWFLVLMVLLALRRWSRDSPGFTRCIASRM